MKIISHPQDFDKILPPLLKDHIAARYQSLIETEEDNPVIFIIVEEEDNLTGSGSDYAFVSEDNGLLGVGSGSVRVRVYFGWTNPLSTLGFYNGPTQNSDQFRKTEVIVFRDRLGRSRDRGNAKIIPLQIFDLQGQPASVRLSVNQWVPGSSPGRGATSLFKFNHLRRFPA